MKISLALLPLLLASTLGVTGACSSSSSGGGAAAGDDAGPVGDDDGGTSTLDGGHPSDAHVAADSAGGHDGGGSDGSTTQDSGGNDAGTPLAAHLVTGYWQDFDNGAQVVSLGNVPTSYGLVAVAFANADPSTPGGVTFSIDSGLASALGGYTSAQFTADITKLHGQGQKVIISVGGQNGAVAVSDAASATNFATSVYGLMTQYGFDGVDIDLENGLTAASMASALQQLSAMAGPSLVITLAPQTIDMQSTAGDYFQLSLAIKDILTIVNMQYYNSGSMLGADGNVYYEGNVDFLTALAAIQLEGGLRPDQVGLGVPASSSAAGSGYVAPSVVNAAIDCLAAGTSCGSFTPTAHYPTIRGAMTWSVNWDGSNGYALATAVSSHLASLP
jgi:chitinase